MKVLFTFIAFMCLPAVVLAECENLNSPDGLLKCVVLNHSIVEIGKSIIAEKELGIDNALKRPNPEFEFEGIENVDGDFTSDFSLLHTFELGGKRLARSNVAKSKKKMAEIDIILVKERLSIETVLNLYRLRQINHEVLLLDEIIHTFNNILDNYTKPETLSPEDSAEYSIISIAASESILKRKTFIRQKNEIKMELSIGLRQEVELADNLLPVIKRDWEPLQIGPISGANLMIAQESLVLANLNYKLEKADSWSDLSVGPKVETSDGNNGDTTVGVVMSLPIPLYNTNDAGKDMAQAQIIRRELEFKYSASILEQKRKYYLSVYNSMGESIKYTVASEQVTSKHTKLHRMVKRGLVSVSTVVELHRQILDYYERLHEMELEGVRAYWEIAALEGRILMEVLK